MSRIRFRPPSHATVLAYLALFVAIGGTAYPAGLLPYVEWRHDDPTSGQS